MSWEIWPDHERGWLCVRFAGHIDTAAGEASVAGFLTALGKRCCHLIVDAQEVGTYHTGARSAWREALLPHRDQLLSLTVVGGGAQIRLGAQILGFALGLPVRHVDRWSDLDEAGRDGASRTG